MTPSALVPAGFAVLIAFSLYRRSRRLFGRQPVQPTRMKFRVVFLLFVGAMLMLRGAHDMQFALAMVGGLGGGVALALFGLHLTRFEQTAQGNFYTPHGGIGLALTLLLLGRLAYRFFIIYPSMQATQGTGADPFSGFERSPLTTAIFGLLIGYYVAYYAGVLVRSGANTPKLPPADGVDKT
jgi:drug/metabolite transporter superfamily protein YnfA